MPEARLYTGEDFGDDRGILRFFNTFDLSSIRRMYEIRPSNTSYFRGWQGHKIESKWFYCLSGSLNIWLVKVDNFESPSPELNPKAFELKVEEPSILEVPGGYATGIQALRANSGLMVFSDYSLRESKADDYRYPKDLWVING
ncbi:hypothetical protein SAMN06265375_10399 [Muriicola jejuensis]|uniref:Sugar epimerase n=1 Tax=Muriicola jejuensis TaxID=504488 RepID=A0A6P0UE88_9FLAO|nr:hypothetical protein [Muriicola jejuensis]NER11535.1 hypothetical protein [Muriicola jejuensis]SMP19879.1 hypothetical protein SAMN06265375_10399 [Muriicola jejuensis]